MSEPHEITIKADAEQLREARAFVGAVFESWHLDSYLGKIIVSELVGNVVRHTDVDKMIVRVYLADAGPVVEVEDGSPQFPVVRPMEPESLSGRGLAMIKLLAAEVGWNACAGGGKCVYAVLR
ncbi:ATP-binding protein [Actinomadura fulvescens]|uniref:Histidine kinase/HSP90-like ATPase domain-containing protein n=1 Tax=Actinomadura fulvescens TaxID=46160 RepID=A0ABN3QM53_9ACTN